MNPTSRCSGWPSPHAPSSVAARVRRPRPEYPLARVKHYAWGLLAPALCTALLWPLRERFVSSSILLTYLLGVFLVATRHGRGASFLASALSAAAFAYFFAPPIFSLAVSDTENIIALGAMLTVAQVTGALVETLRTQVDLAAQRESRTAALYRLSVALAGARHAGEVIATAVRQIQAELGANAVLLLPDRAGRLRYPTEPPLPESFRGANLARAEQVLTRAGVPDAEVLSTEGSIFMPFEASGRRIGTLVMAAAQERGDLLSGPEHAAFLAMFRSQIGQALERAQLAEQARKASIQAEAEGLRNSLLSAISHDLRTPLTRIMGAAGILAERERVCSLDERLELSAFIQDEAVCMSELMGKILDMARITAGEIMLHREWNTAEEIVGATLARLERLLDQRSINIRLADDLPLLWVDAVLLQQVLTNLIENTIKYTPAGSPIDIAADRADGGLCLEIADRGPGLPAGVEERVFEKFFRVDAESARSGTGLGLALCRAVIEAHGGRIAAANRPEGGAVFTLWLPVHEPPAIAPEDEAET